MQDSISTQAKDATMNNNVANNQNASKPAVTNSTPNSNPGNTTKPSNIINAQDEFKSNSSNEELDPTQLQKRHKILVVEDEEDSKDILVSLLNTANKYDVSSAADGQDALAKMEAEKMSNGGYDLVLLDIVMPKLDGVETLRLIKTQVEKYGTPSILMLTNLGGDVAVETAMNLGAAGYLMKVETEPDQLLKRVAEELNAREGKSDSIIRPDFGTPDEDKGKVLTPDFGGDKPDSLPKAA
jgi:CheY-like chemotaxis protein